MIQNNTLTKNIYGTFAKYVSLNVVSMIAFSCYILADTFFVANAVGANGLVALNLVIPIFSVLNASGALLGIGGATRFSICNGANDTERSRRIFTQIFIIGLVIGVIVTVVCMAAPGAIVRLLGADDEVFLYAKQYFISIMAFSIFFIINHILVAFVKNDGAPKLAMVAMLSSSLFNVVFDYVLMYPLGMGMVGAAVASGISPIVSIMILCIHFLRKKNTFRLVKTKFFAADISKSLSAGVSSFISEISNGVMIFVFNTAILKIAGNIGVGAYSVIANFSLVGVSIFTGLGQGIQPIVSANFGANNRKRVKKVWWLTIITAVLIGALYYIGCYFLRYQIVGIFNRDNILELTNLASHGMIIYNVAFFVMGIGIAGSYFLASISKPQFATLISVLRGFLLPLPLVLLLPLALGIDGVWASVPITEIIVAITVIIIVAIITTKQDKKEKISHADTQLSQRTGDATEGHE